MTLKRCRRCIFPETVPGISFDEKGVCCFCRDYRRIEYQGEDKLLEKIRASTRKFSRYQCVVPLSGGRDSTFVLYLAKARYNLKTLADNYDNEFRNEPALLNMKNAANALGVDFVSIKSRTNLARKIVRYHLKSAQAKGPERIFGFCVACEYGYKAVSYRTAIANDVPLILWGSSRIEKTTHLTQNRLSQGYFRELLRRFDITEANNLRSLFYQYRQRLEFPVGGNFVRRLLLKPPHVHDRALREIRLYDYVPWDRQRIEDTIMSELGWRKPDHSLTSWRIDCKLKGLVDLSFMNIFGCSKYCFGVHNMINEGQVSREEALEVEERMAAQARAGLARVFAEDVGLSEKEINRLALFG